MTPVAPPLRSTQVILAAFALGVLTFLGVVVFLRLSGTFLGAGEIPEALNLVLIVLVPGNLSVYFVLRKVLVARVVATRSESLEAVRQGRVPPPLQTLSIVGGALAESVGLFGVVLLLLGAPWLVLTAPLLAIVLILLQIPTQGRLERIVRGV